MASSRPEAELAVQLRASGIPFEREVVLDELRPRRWRWDFRMGRVLVEVQGGTWTGGRHARGAGYENDCEKMCAAVAAGFRVLAVVPAQIRSGQALAWIGAVVEGSSEQNS